MARRHEYQYGRGGQYRDRDRADDRGYMERAGDEVRSWFGDDDAERRRSMDEQRDREHERRYGNERQRTDWNQRGDWNRYETRRDWNQSSRDRADWNRSDWDRQSNWRRPEQWTASSSAMGYRDWHGTSPRADWDRDRSWGGSQESLRDRDRSYSGAGVNQRRDWSVDDGRTEFGQQRFGRGPKGYHRSDARIFEDVCDRLTYSDVDAENIEVRVENGEVTLAGSVRDRLDKRRAEDVAEEVPGVRDVHNNIRVQRPDRGIGQSEMSASDQPGTVLGVNPTQSSSITNTPPKGNTRS